MTVALASAFFLGTFYRSASLYHPQRRAILHLKTQKRKIKSKDKEKYRAQQLAAATAGMAPMEAPPLFDCATLKSRTVQIMLLSTALAFGGINAPLFLLVRSPTVTIARFRVSVHQ